jgi:hypothetical protein
VIATMVPATSIIRASNAKKRGGQKGFKGKLERPQSFWHGLCSKYYELVKTAANKKIPLAAFLRSKQSGPDIDGSKSNCTIFGKKYKLFKEGRKLLLTDRKRVRKGKFDDVGEKLIEYIMLRARLYKRDKCGLSWALMTEKALKFGAALGYSAEAFSASPQWLRNTLQKNHKIGINLHGEAAEMDDAERATIMGEWRTSFHALIEKHNLTPDVIYNADQTGLYHTKLPNRLYINKSKRSE